MKSYFQAFPTVLSEPRLALVFPVSCSHSGFMTQVPGRLTTVATKHRERMDGFLPSFSNSLYDLLMGFEKMVGLEGWGGPMLNDYWLLPASNLGTHSSNSSHNLPQHKRLTSSQLNYLTPCPSCLSNTTVSHDYRVRQCGIDRLSCSSIIGFLVTKKDFVQYISNPRSSSGARMPLVWLI